MHLTLQGRYIITALAHPTPSDIPSAGLKELPTRFEECDIDHLIELIASMLTRLITHNDQIPFTSTSLTRFHSRSPPAISISDYLRRIYKYTNPEPICLILILNYIDRICKNLINFTICSLTVHRFCITSVTVGSKFICDSFYSNSRYAKVGGISLTEINLLEREFLLAIDYRLSTTNEELNKYYLSLVESHPCYKIDRTRLITFNKPQPPLGSTRAAQKEELDEGVEFQEEDHTPEGAEPRLEEEDAEERAERKAKKLRGKDHLPSPQVCPVGHPKYTDPVCRDPQNPSDSHHHSPHHQVHTSISAYTNILPDSIVED
ncbi:hypothetical protein PCANC_04643 [Puccinia coronata f. sp. avenae]|uniref:Cyclin n=1 Tax=Puccinia coronata f. sp. avenae TaxID=200324 RepID=A0A2N5W0G1_9BASI|nr:hypothetical protein PCANC_04643 [Puccinia coronata f. sp. avenae]